MSSSSALHQLPFDVLLAICGQLPPCACVERGDYTRALGCSRDHAPGAFGGGELSALRQTSRAWRTAALGQGLRVVVASSRWMHGGDGSRLAAIRRYHGRHVRRLVFRSSDAYHSGRHRAGDGVCAELEAALALAWPSLAAVAVDWFSSDASDHIRIAAAVQRYAPRIRDFYLRDKAAAVARIVPLLGPVGARVARLAVTPYGFNQHWAALLPSERGAAAAVRRLAGQLSLLAVGGPDVTGELLEALHATQPRLCTLQLEHASVEALRSAGSLGALTTLRLEHVLVGADGVLPLSAGVLPRLTTLSVRHVWRAADRAADSARGAVSLQNDRWLAPVWAHRWHALRVLALPAIDDIDAQALPHACPSLERLVTHSLDYAGPRLSAAGLVCVLSRLPRLTHLAIEQRRADGSPGYDIAGAALCRLLGCADDDARFGDRMLSRMSPPPSPTPAADCSPPPPPSALRLRALCIPYAAFTAPALDALVHQLPSLSFLSVTLRSDSLFAGDNPPRPHLSLRRLALRADEDVLADPLWLSAWLAQRFPALRECCTNHARSHRQTVAELRALAPAVSFTRLSSRALQTTCN
ncbi:hypothetical protein H4R27_001027 [Coemansia aciculifera]|nr:hypothetical protein H4R27_001027 [Coemansia aciculifera]